MKRPGWLPVALVALAAAACDPISPDEPGALVPKTVMEDPTLPAIEVNGARFHAETFGDPANPAIVFLHGGPGGDYRSMLELAKPIGGPSLADDYFVVYWDQRGAGLSQRVGKETLTIEQYLADLDAIVNRYSSGRPVYLVGISWGGMFATDYINTHPTKVAGAVLIEPGPMDGATMERIQNDMFEMKLGAEWLNDYAWSSGFFTPDGHARKDYERMLGLRDGQPRYHQSLSNPEPGWRQGAVANRSIIESAQDDDGTFDYDFTTNLRAYTTPVQFITGSLSEILGASLQRQQVKHFPSANLVEVSGAGHDVAWVRTADVLAIIRPYLAARRGGVQ